MGIRLKKSAKKSSGNEFCPNFYAQFRGKNGRVTCCRLQTRVRGRPPESGLLSDKGDEEFERSRIAAECEFAEFVATSRDARIATSKLVASVKAATGQNTCALPLADLASWYRDRERILPTERNKDWLDWKDSVISRFAEWAAMRNCTTVLAVTKDIAQEYCLHIAQSLSVETLKKSIYRLTSAFKACLPTGMDNPFDGAYKVTMNSMPKTVSNVHRIPLSEQQLLSLWNEARKHGDFWHALTVVASCTGLRIGDACNLRWSCVNLADGVLQNVKTDKTGAIVTIPIFAYDKRSAIYHPILGEMRRVLEIAENAKTDEFVLPSAHWTYENNPDAIYKMGKSLFANAIFADEVKGDKQQTQVSATAVNDAIMNSSWNQAKRDRVLECYERFSRGERYPAIAKAMGYPAYNRISMDLAAVEILTGMKIRPRSESVGIREKSLIQKTRMTRRVGVRAASLYGWHSLRHTFVVLASNAGVPMDIIQSIVGHANVKMTMEYFNPTARIAAENMKKIMSARSATKADASDALVDGLLKSLSPEAKAALLKKLLE